MTDLDLQHSLLYEEVQELYRQRITNLGFSTFLSDQQLELKVRENTLFLTDEFPKKIRLFIAFPFIGYKKE